jgi:hypothetical protein
MVVRLSALCAGRPLSPGRFLVLISGIGWVDPRAIVRLEISAQLKKPVTSLWIDPSNFIVNISQALLLWQQIMTILSTDQIYFPWSSVLCINTSTEGVLWSCGWTDYNTVVFPSCHSLCITHFHSIQSHVGLTSSVPVDILLQKEKSRASLTVLDDKEKVGKNVPVLN